MTVDMVKDDDVAEYKYKFSTIMRDNNCAGSFTLIGGYS